MDIRSAILKADKEHKMFIFRKDWVKYGGDQRLQPSNSDFLTAMYRDNQMVGARWEPSKDELLATDWEVE